MTTLYQPNSFNKQINNNNNCYNINALNQNIFNNNSSNLKDYSTFIIPQNQNINIQNYLPYPSGWLTSIPNYSPQKMYNINIFNGNPKLYQRSIVDINNKKQKFPRFSAKQPKNNINIIPNYNNYFIGYPQLMKIQRSNTSNYIPRLSSNPRIGQKIYFNLGNNNYQLAERRTLSNGYRSRYLKENNEQMKNNKNNIEIISQNTIPNNNNLHLNNNDIQNGTYIQKINNEKINENPENNDEEMNNTESKIAKVTKISTKKIILSNNQLANDPALTNNNNNIISYNSKPINSIQLLDKSENINQFDNLEQISDISQIRNTTKLLPNNQLMNNTQINKDQFTNITDFPNSINPLNNNTQPIVNQSFNNNFQLNLQTNNFKNESLDSFNTQENYQKNQTITPFLTINGEIMNNTQCTEYFRETSTAPVTSYGYSQNQNAEHRKYMEDEGRVIENFNGDPNKILFCIFDGHGGGQVSKFLQEHFGAYMKKIYNYEDYSEGFTEIFQTIDNDIKLLDYPKVGSTATIVYIEKDKNNKRTLYCANVGDSRCVLVSKRGCFRMSYDDKVSDPQENERINQEAGIIVGGRVYGKLILSRSFGDWLIKDFGVIVDPHFIKYELNEEDLFCIIASDGVWDVMGDEECSVLENMNVNTGELSKNIINECLRRKTHDNLSCFVISLK